MVVPGTPKLEAKHSQCRDQQDQRYRYVDLFKTHGLPH